MCWNCDDIALCLNRLGDEHCDVQQGGVRQFRLLWWSRCNLHPWQPKWHSHVRELSMPLRSAMACYAQRTCQVSLKSFQCVRSSNTVKLFKLLYNYAPALKHFLPLASGVGSMENYIVNSSIRDNPQGQGAIREKSSTVSATALQSVPTTTVLHF